MRLIGIVLLFLSAFANAEVITGADRLFETDYINKLKNKRIGLITNHTAINRNLVGTLQLFEENAQKYGYKMTTLFSPEHGIDGSIYGEGSIEDSVYHSGIPIYSLHGMTKRPTADMLKQVDILVFDIQDIGSRSYTYNTTLFYAMEEAAKYGIEMMVLDRPNPINGLTIDGPMLEQKWRSFVGYVNVPYCHGMTVGELAQFFNCEYGVKCKLTVVPMKGWQRSMTFAETGLTWIPTSPQIPEGVTAWYYPTTGLLGELQMVSIGIGYTLPFKIVGAPWIDADDFAHELNACNYPGVNFQPFRFTPFFGRFAHQHCNGILIEITNPKVFKPVKTQYLIASKLKEMYPREFNQALSLSAHRKQMFCKVSGTEELYNQLKSSNPTIYDSEELHKDEKQKFLKVRQKYLIPEYGYKINTDHKRSSSR
jgi:uncharacterized protein YbbC (DUF1343 family)